MKIKSVSGIVCFVKDIKRTVKFYEFLGLKFKIKEKTRAVGYSNWYWIEFLTNPAKSQKIFAKDYKAKTKGVGIFTYLSVDDIDKVFKECKSKGIRPLSEPVETEFGNIEFVIADPDGFKLVLFKRK